MARIKNKYNYKFKIGDRLKNLHGGVFEVIKIDKSSSYSCFYKILNKSKGFKGQLYQIPDYSIGSIYEPEKDVIRILYGNKTSDDSKK